MLDLDAIEARVNAATEGPWRYKISRYEDDASLAIEVERATLALSVADGEPMVFAIEEDAAFVCAARTDIPALIAEVRALREELQRLVDDSGDQYLEIQHLKSRHDWIPVAERLPEDGTSVLVYTKGPGSYVDSCWYGDGYFQDCGSEVEVTHWQPLPAAPEVK